MPKFDLLARKNILLQQFNECSDIISYMKHVHIAILGLNFYVNNWEFSFEPLDSSGQARANIYRIRPLVFWSLVI